MLTVVILLVIKITFLFHLFRNMSSFKMFLVSHQKRRNLLGSEHTFNSEKVGSYFINMFVILNVHFFFERQNELLIINKLQIT